MNSLHGAPTRALVIDEPWIGLILDGKKIWEMRTKPTTLRGRIGLIRKRSGLVVGTVELLDSLAPLNAAAMAATKDRHCIDPGWQPNALSAGWVVPWVLRDARPLGVPVPYAHPNGAVSWVLLDASVTDAIAGRPAAPDAIAGRPAAPDALRIEHFSRARAPSQTAPVPPPAPFRVAALPAMRVPVSAASSTGAVVLLTGGNIRNGHIYLRRVAHLLPADAVGGPNASTAALRPLTVVFDPGPTITTDVAGDKMILRQRGPVRAFFEASAAVEGDEVVITFTGSHSLHIALVRGRRSA